MTNKTLTRLLHKRSLTANERVQVMRAAHRLLNQSINCFSAVQDACDTAAETIMNLHDDRRSVRRRSDLSSKEEEHMDRLEETRDELETLVETLDNLDIPDTSEVR